MENLNKEWMQEIDNARESSEVMNEVTSMEQQEMDQCAEMNRIEMETAEQQEMNGFAETQKTGHEAAEQQEMDQGTKLGYSASYYESQMATALEKGNDIAYKNARRNWAKAKVKEST